MKQDKIICKFSGTSLIVVETDGTNTNLKHVDVALHLGNNLDPRKYYDQNGEGDLTPIAVDVLINCFIQGLNTIIKGAHKRGYGKDFEYMKKVVDELNRSFTHPGKMEVLGKDLKDFGK